MSPARSPQPPIAIDPAQWDAAIAATTGPQLVVGGPGTGKTEFLVRRAIHLLGDGVRPEAITILGFSRRGVAEVRSRIREGVSDTMGALDVATFHSYAARLLETNAAVAGWESNPQILTGPEQVALIHQLLMTEDPSRWSPAFRQLLTTQTFAREMTDFILRAAEQLHTPETIAEMGRADWRGVPAFVAGYHQTLRRRGRIDYGTLIGVAVELIERTRPEPTADARYVLVDEYQDTTPAQVRMLQALRAQGCEVLAAADPYQSIYSFRGATVENVAAFEAAFGTAGIPATRYLLTTSFRTPQAILDGAVRVTTGDLPGATGAVVPAPGGGAVETYLFDQQVEEADWIAAEAQRLHLTEAIPYSRIGVFVRSKRRLLSDLSRALERRRIPHELPGTRLTDQPAVRFVLDLAAAATGYEGPHLTEQALRRVLLGSRVRLPIGAYRSLERHVRSTGSWPDSIAATLPEWAPLAELLRDGSWASQLPAAEGLWRVWTEFPGVEDMVNDPDRAEERAAWRSMAQVLARWGERNPTGTLLDYRMLAGSEDFEAQPLLSYRRPAGDRLILTTLHQAKGLELDVAFIADAVDGVFPDLRTRDSLLGVRHLLAYVPTESAAYRAFRLQEESRLAYTAMTRARRRVVWTATARGLDDAPGRPSRFFSKLAAILGSDPQRARGIIDLSSGSRRPPVTPNEAEAALRRCLTDAGAPAPRRLAALHTLATGNRWSLRPPDEYGGIPPRGPNTGLIDAAAVLSPSQAESYELCPRRYALERRLKVGTDTSLHAYFGTLIHAVLEAVEQRALEAGEPRSNRDAALAEFHARFDPADFGGHPFAASWLQRGIDGLTKLYDSWLAPRRWAAFLERALQTEIGGVAWIGRADRIDVGPHGVTIVDYKTARKAATVADAAESLQLGFYVLAAGRDPEITACGDVAGAELWYPMANAQSVTTREFDMDRLDNVAGRLHSIAAGITGEDWSPLPGPHCERCNLRALCPAWTDGGPEFA